MTSTNDEARHRAEAGAAEGLVVCADTQTAGRGRRGRVWLDSGPRSLLTSVLLRPELAPSNWGLLVNAAGLAVAEALRELGCPAQTRWPNDVVCAGRKVAGILLESRAPEYAILGLGVNVLGQPEDLPAAVRELATTVAATARDPVSRENLLVAIMARLEELYDCLLAGQAEMVIARQQELETTLGQPVTIEATAGSYEAQAVRLAACGGLVVRPAGGPERVLTAGELVKLRPCETEGPS
jgi:BirA family biotin operon repressor/biotin-[acetyl-CoA-carboxylase] ligase